MSTLPWLDDGDITFPDPDLALTDPNGLLAVGGILSPERLLEAYSFGIFPWFEEGQPVLWWTPDPRMVLFPGELHISKSLAKAIKKAPFLLTSDRAFREVMQACAGDRPYARGTWITEEMIEAYCQLHDLGYAHSVEAWEGGTLVGGLYGIAIGKVFFGESMFSHRDNASKIAFSHLVKTLKDTGYALIDCQVPSDHLASFGAREISRADFMKQLPKRDSNSRQPGQWPLQ